MSVLSRRVVAAVIVAVVVALDQLTKAWALRSLPGRSIPLLPTLEFDLSFNTGISFGAGAEFGQVFGLVISVIVIVLARVVWSEGSTVRAFLLAAVLGGAIGNLADRILRAENGVFSGTVVDFIDVSWFAVFNVADMFVTCCLAALLLFEAAAERRSNALDGSQS
jgi:signal peptidase II